MYILGLSAFYHDSAACLIKSGDIIAAAQEERFTRIKHEPSFPKHAILYCLKEAGITPEQIEQVVFYEKPFIKFERLLETYLAFAPKGLISFTQAIPKWVKDRLFQKTKLCQELALVLGDEVNWKQRLLFSEHHLSHAASAFYPSPFERAAVLTLDGVGEWTTTSVAIGHGKHLKVIKEIKFPHSLGLLYSAFTYYTGFKVNSGEYKLMGLAPYGQPCYTDIIQEKLVHIAPDGSFQLNMDYFNFATGLTMTNARFHRLFGGPPRIPESALTQREMDLAASIQKVIEKILVRLARNIAEETGERHLCLAGGVALNCVANGILLRENIFEQIWIQPAAGDAGGALGAALSAWYLHHHGERLIREPDDKLGDLMKGAYLGPEFSDQEIETELRACGAVFTKLTDDELLEQVSGALANEKVVGWMQGRMEFGPRALGARSILADPRSPYMQKQLNLKIKYRESFRPFAPSVLREELEQWFEHKSDSPYMLFVAEIKAKQRLAITEQEQALFGLEKLNVPRSSIPAVTHVDYSARLHTVHNETNPLFHALITKFKEKTAYPLLINTSFNVRGEPIVCTPTDAFKCFMGTELDLLSIGHYLLHKQDQDPFLQLSHEQSYALD